jgi:tripartite-type tricarboxylate transporter receptor subunit TctC
MGRFDMTTKVARSYLRLGRIFAAAIAAALAWTHIAAADEPYPSRPIRLIVPFPPDVMGRLISQGLSE